MPLKNARFQVTLGTHENRKNNLILIMTAVKQDKTLELSKHWSADSTPARNEVIMKTTYPVKSVKCEKIKLGCMGVLTCNKLKYKHQFATNVGRYVLVVVTLYYPQMS